MLQVKNSIPPGISITTAEIDSLMFDWSGADQLTPSINPAYRPILELEDIVLVHIYPFWNGMPIQGAANFTVQRYRAIQALMEREFPGQNKRVIIGEAGWPSGGGENFKAIPSLENQSRYLREFLNLANQYQVEFFYFDAFDELWKREGNGIGQKWGYSYSDRTAKHPFYGVLLKPDLVFPSSVFLPVTFNLSSPITAPTSSSTLVDVVYKDWPEAVDGFVASGFMGDIHNIQIDECYRADTAEGETSVHATFTPTGALGWGGVYWQYPDGNWGDNAKGKDLGAANKITFSARGAKGGERIKFFAGGIGDATTPYHDSLRPEVSTGFILLGSDWQTYTINLRNQDLSHMIGGFGWSTDKCANPDGADFFLDNIQYEYDPNLPSPPGHGPVFPVYTDAAAQDNHYTPAGWLGNSDQIKFNECWQDNPHSGKTSIRNDYSGLSGWGGVYWLFPATNWGDRPGGYDLTGAKQLTFWARTDTPNASVKFLIGGVGYPNGIDCSSRNNPFPDSVCPKIETPLTLSPNWTKYTIALPEGRDLHRLVGGFGWKAESPVTFYLDDIIYEFQ
ncbi:MAG TPA: glycosyl hydrolase family 17 protein [Anaerolineales bacterium]